MHILSVFFMSCCAMRRRNSELGTSLGLFISLDIRESQHSYWRHLWEICLQGIRVECKLFSDGACCGLSLPWLMILGGNEPLRSTGLDASITTIFPLNTNSNTINHFPFENPFSVPWPILMRDSFTSHKVMMEWHYCDTFSNVQTQFLK